MTYPGTFEPGDSVRVSHWKLWDRHKRIVVGDEVIGELTSTWISDSYGGIAYTRLTLVQLTTNDAWRIATVATQPRRSFWDRRVVVSSKELSQDIAAYWETPDPTSKGSVPQVSSSSGEVNRLLELPDGRRFIIGTNDIRTESGQLAMTVRNVSGLRDGYDEFGLETSIPLELVLLAWHVVHRDWKPPSDRD